MAQKFTSLDDAAEQLGVSKDRLNQLREAGKVRAYRDGASWKFRGEDIDKLAEEGLPPLDGPPSDLSLDVEDEPELADEAAPADEPAPAAKAEPDDELELADEPELVDEPADESKVPAAPPSASGSGLELELADDEVEESADEQLASEPMASDVSLEDVDEPTVAGLDDEGDDESDNALALDPDDSIDVYSDSILLSEAELGESTGRPPSTIIGKADLDADLDLSPIDPGTASDVKLAPASDILPADDDDALDLPSPSGDFAGLEELEVDLEAESSRILSPEDVAKVKKGVAAKQKADSDLQLAPSDSDAGAAASDVDLGGSFLGGSGVTGLSALELDEDQDDDQVLGEGSDVTLSGESSGINIISPSDSGLALDEVKLDLSGASAIGSSLDLGGSAIEDVSLEPLMVGEGMPDSKIGEDFQLTPLGEESAEEEERDSSQVIALDEIAEESAGAPLSFGGGASEEEMLSEDFGGVGLTPGAAPVGVVSATETPFSMANVLGLAGCMLLLGLCGMMVYDLMRNIWSWDDVTTLNSSLLESVLNPFL